MKRSADVIGEQPVPKRAAVEEGLQLVAVPTPTNAGTSATATLLTPTLMKPEEPQRLSIEVNPSYLKRLQQRGEIGFRKALGHKKPTYYAVELIPNEFRRCISDVLAGALLIRYHSLGSYRDTEISAEIEDIVPVTVDMCMSALYARLRTIHKSHSKYATRYGPAALYTKDVELPLPIALAIEQIGVFETHSLVDNLLIVPNYPEGTKNEGRSSDEFQVTDYLAYLPTFRELDIPMKSIDIRLKSGTAWWTYMVRNSEEVTDLLCSLPPSHYSDLSAQLRACFLAEDPAKLKTCQEIIKYDSNEAANYGARYRDLTIGYNVRAFLALCHGPEEEWSHGL